MTIEWMIKHLQLVAESSKDKKHELSKISITNEQLAEHCEQIAEWLEELKAMRNLDKTNYSDGYNQGRQDVLKDVAKIIDNYTFDRDVYPNVSLVNMIRKYIYEQTKESKDV